MKKFFAFTLAETLIVMGIIGIVSALTLPNLNSSTGEKEKVAKVMKIYRDLTDAFGRAQVIYGPFDEWFLNDNNDNAIGKRFGERITEFMKISKNCGIGADKGCFPNFNNCGEIYYKVILADGASVCFGEINDSHIYIDIDGPNKGPNSAGKDRFELYIYMDDLDNISYDRFNYDDGDAPCSSASSTDCIAWILEYGNMDYLKCFDKLKWGQKTSCK